MPSDTSCVILAAKGPFFRRSGDFRDNITIYQVRVDLQESTGVPSEGQCVTSQEISPHGTVSAPPIVCLPCERTVKLTKQNEVGLFSAPNSGFGLVGGCSAVLPDYPDNPSQQAITRTFAQANSRGHDRQQQKNVSL